MHACIHSIHRERAATTRNMYIMRSSLFRSTMTMAMTAGCCCGRLRPNPTPIFPRILPTHKHFIPRTFTPFPESAPSFSNEKGVADSTVLWPVGLFPGAVAAGYTLVVACVKWVEWKRAKEKTKKKKTYQIMRFACSLGWSVASSWHLHTHRTIAVRIYMQTMTEL